MEFVFDDGGRAEAGFKGSTGDCVCRAISIATGKPYSEVYKLINEYGKKERPNRKTRKGNKYNGSRSSARTGVYTDTTRKIMEDLGWEWTPLMNVGSGCTTHMSSDELPDGTIIVKLSRHLACVIDGVLHDTYDCTRDGSRCVYGYYTKKREDNIIKKIPGIKGIYGNRYSVSGKYKKVIDVFKALSMWESGCEYDGKYYVHTFELPFGHSIEENPLLMNLINGYKLRISE